MPLARFIIAATFAFSAAQAFAQETTAEAEAAPAVSGDTVIATVNGVEVTLGDIVAMRSELPAQYQSIPDLQLYDGLLEQWTSQILLSQAAERAGYLDRSEVKRGLAMQRTSYLAELYIRDRINETITQEVVNLEYKKRYLDTPAEEEFSAAHILVEDEETAKSLTEEARGGADFAKLAQDNSIGPSAPRGGDLGWFGKGQMVPAFEAAVVALEAGAVSDPVQTQFGWHVIKLNEKREKARPALEEVMQSMVGEMSRDITDALVKALLENGEVTKPEDRPGLSRLRDDAAIKE